MRKVFLSLTSLMFVVVLGFGTVAAQDDPVTLEFWGGWTGPDGAIMQGLVDQWNAENPDV